MKPHKYLGLYVREFSFTGNINSWESIRKVVPRFNCGTLKEHFWPNEHAAWNSWDFKIALKEMIDYETLS